MSGLLDLSDWSEIWIENPSYRVFGDWKRRFHSLYIGSFFGWGGLGENWYLCFIN